MSTREVLHIRRLALFRSLNEKLHTCTCHTHNTHCCTARAPVCLNRSRGLPSVVWLAAESRRPVSPSCAFPFPLKSFPLFYLGSLRASPLVVTS